MIRTMAATLTASSLLAGTPASGVSDEARFLDRSIEQDWISRQGSRALGDADLFDELAELADECGQPDWDGYGAAPIRDGAIVEAQRFLRALPAGLRRPTLGAEPDGHVTFEWYAAPHRTLSVSIGDDGTLHYAAMIGSSRQFGTEPLLGDCPETILTLIRSVQQT